MGADFWERGDVVIWRDGWRARTYFAGPLRVVEDSVQQLALYLAEGTRFTFPPGSWPFGDAHPWAEKDGWTGHGVLVLHYPRDAFTIWHFWEGAERRFAGWYVNLQAPLRRDGLAFDTQDHELDIVIAPDGSWHWKDEQELEDWVGRGRFTADEVAAIRREGERVVAEWPFPTGWEEWRPDPSWPVPELPEDWDAPA
jgi:hypothetical protein